MSFYCRGCEKDTADHYAGDFCRECSGIVVGVVGDNRMLKDRELLVKNPTRLVKFSDWAKNQDGYELFIYKCKDQAKMCGKRELKKVGVEVKKVSTSKLGNARHFARKLGFV